MRGTLFQSLAFAIAVLIPGLCGASVATVPDDYPTIQAAIDIGADTVFVREGDYSEVPQAYRGVALLGLGTARPRIAGLTITNPYGWLSRKWSISDVDIAGPVVMHTGNPDARLLDIAFDRCRLAQGLIHDAGDTYDIDTLSLTHCRLEGQSDGIAVVLKMHADTSTAGWSWNVDESASVDSSWFSGGANQALRVGGEDTEASASILGNVIEHAPRGMYLPGFGIATVQSNVVRHTGTGMELDVSLVLLKNNEISDCDVGLLKWWGYATLTDNNIVGIVTTGAHFVSPDDVRAERNVIGRCGGSAVWVERPTYGSGLGFIQNTIYESGGSGVLIDGGTITALTFEDNVGYGSSEWGLQVSTVLSSSTLGCNDWFANGLGAVSGVAPGATDMAVDPGFCDLANDSVSLYSDSPLVGHSACGQIGARGVGCSPPTLSGMSVASIHAGLRVQWAFATPPASGSWIERAEQLAGAWDSLGTGVPGSSNGFELLDAAVVPNREYHYRVAWKDRGVIVHGLPATGTWTEAGRLSSVTPSPAHGEATIEWVLSHAGTTEIQVFDLSGREVANIAKASYGVGRHQARWDGRWEGRGAAPAGMYVVRISSADGTSTHRVLLLR